MANKISDIFKKTNTAVKKSISGATDTLEQELRATTMTLRSEIKRLVDDYVKSEKTTNIESVDRSSKLASDTEMLPKEDLEILKKITGNNPYVNPYRQYSSINDGIIVGRYNSKGDSKDYSSKPYRFTVRIQHEDYQTIEAQYDAAHRFFRNAIYALPDKNNKIRYYINPNRGSDVLDLSDNLKIKCSTRTGIDPDGANRKGLTPRQRFNKDIETKYHSEWDLKQKFTRNELSNKFIDITDMIDLVRSNNISAAKEIIKNNMNSTRVREIYDRLEVMEKSQEVVSSDIDYISIISLIDSIELKKKIKKNTTSFTLTSPQLKTRRTNKQLENQLRLFMGMHAVKKIPSWFKTFNNALWKILGKYK